jgi:hypothetical protein
LPADRAAAMYEAVREAEPEAFEPSVIQIACGWTTIRLRMTEARESPLFASTHLAPVFVGSTYRPEAEVVVVVVVVVARVVVVVVVVGRVVVVVVVVGRVVVVLVVVGRVVVVLVVVVVGCVVVVVGPVPPHVTPLTANELGTGLLPDQVPLNPTFAEPPVGTEAFQLRLEAETF